MIPESRAHSATLDSITAFEKLSPFGMANPQIQILIRNVRIAGEFRKMGAEQKHARFPVSDGRTVHDVIWWNAGELPFSQFDIAVTPQLNTYNGTTRVQLKLLDFRPTEI